MIGKKNIVFGFFYLVLTAALGPVMVVNYLPAVASAEAQKQEKLGFLQTAAADNFEVNLEPMKPVDIAKANAAAVLALSNKLNRQAPIDAIKGGPHAHGNLEALLNIVVGVVLLFLAVPRAFKQAISWIFIAGALLHSGLLYLAVALELPWAGTLLGTAFGYLGPALILIGMAAIGVAATMGWRAEPVRD
jgi:hypothetical protein